METHVCWGTTFGSLLSLEFIPSFSYSLSLYYSFILSFMCDFNKIGVCVKWENKVQHVKNIYNGFWFKVK